MGEGSARDGVLSAGPAAAGVILYPKPAGVTSHDVVAGVRGSLRGAGREVKVGHAGTLDPFATGLLLVLVGKATRVQRYLMELSKAYRATVRLGWRSDTGDRDGVLEETGRVPERVELPVGDIEQRPPAYSAVKVGGERLYERARRGDPVEGAPRRVTVYRADLAWRKGDRALVEIECSAGTYVRQLVATLEDAYCEELERTRIGPFRLEDADAERLVPLADALDFLPERKLDPEEARGVAHGRALDGAPAGGGAEAVGPGAPAVRLTTAAGLVAIAEVRGDRLQPVVVMAP
jgi:tRNA pseudouridine55 synthase